MDKRCVGNYLLLQLEPERYFEPFELRWPWEFRRFEEKTNSKARHTHLLVKPLLFEVHMFKKETSSPAGLHPSPHTLTQRINENQAMLTFPGLGIILQ